MTMNVMDFWWEVLAVVSGAAILLVFGIALILGKKPTVPPGSRGYRGEEDSGTEEVIRPDGYVDSFAGVIEEAGGSLPPIVKLSLIGIGLWWLAYLIINWEPHLFPYLARNFIPH